LEEIQTILSLLPEPAATAFAVASFMGLRHGEIQGLLWENYRAGELFVPRSIWNGRVNDPKTRKGRTCSSDSPACRTSRDAPSALRQSRNRADLYQLRWQTAHLLIVFTRMAGSRGAPLSRVLGNTQSVG